MHQQNWHPIPNYEDKIQMQVICPLCMNLENKTKNDLGDIAIKGLDI